MPSSLNGLNIVQPVPSDSTSQDLLTGPFPDLSLWTHLPFDADDGPATNESRFGQMGEEDSEGRSGLEIQAAAIHDGHVNVVTGTTVGNFSLLPQTSDSTPGSSLDLASILSSFGINPLVAAQQSAPAPSLAQLLAMNAANPLLRYSDTPSTHAPPRVEPHPVETSLASPPTKRQRVRKSSVSTRESSPDSPAGALSSPLSTAEDKRRRNTVASARFRLKKKERELALENKTKELEVKVNELEKECEGLRRENGWLKGLVVGVTGVAQKQPAGTKRLREETLS